MTNPYRAEREFGLIVGGILTLLSCWWYYRGKLIPVANLTLPIGMLLVVLATVFPRALVYPNKAWMALATILGFVTTPIILGIIYYFIVTPIGLAKRMFGWDPLSRRAESKGSYWVSYSQRQRDVRHFEKMF